MEISGEVVLKSGVILPSGFEIIATADGRAVNALDGRLIHIAGRGIHREDLETPLDVTMRALLNPETKVYEVASVEISRRDGQPEISGSLVRSVRFKELMVWGVSRGLVGWNPSSATLTELDAFTRLAAGELTLQAFESGETYAFHEPIPHAEIAVMVYDVARALGLPPLKRVAEVLGVSRSTAIRMMSRARAEGLLD